MRITFLLPYAGLAGGVRVVAIYAQRLMQRGHDVNIVSTLRRIPGRKNRAIQGARRFVQRLTGGTEPSHLNDIDVPARTLNHTGPITDRDVPDGDVVVATWWETAEWLANLSPRKGAKAYFVQHYEVHEGQPVTRVKATWALPMRKIAVAQWLADIAAKDYGDPDVPVVPNAVDLELFRGERRGKQSAPTVGVMYSTRHYKGCDVCLRAFEKASRKLSGLRLRSFGAEPVSESLPLPASAEYDYAPTQERLRAIYGSCDAWLFGSRTEGFGLPLLEAMACRTPVIATPAGAARELLAGGGGCLVKSEDPDHMADAIQRVLSLPDHQWREMSDRARTTVCDYTWDDATDRFEAALRQIVSCSERGEPVTSISGRRMTA